jgi:hypothetical protein
MFEKLINSSQFSIEEISIVIKDGTKIDLTNVYEEISLFDSLFMPVMSGEILIRDSVGLSGKLYYDGSETILIHIKKDKNSDVASFKKAFRIYKQSNRVSEGHNSEYYILNFVADELLFSDQQKVNQSYETTYSEIVKKILVDYLMVPSNNLGGIYEDSQGIKKVVIPNLRPIEAIEWCCKRAIDINFSPNFLFWQNTTGYNFATLSTILQNPEILDIKFFPKNSKLYNSSEEMSSAKSIEVVEGFDTIESTREGVLAGKFIGFDPITRTYATRQVSYGDHFDSVKHGNDYPNFGLTQNRGRKNNIETFDSRKSLSIFGASRKFSNYIKDRDPDSINKIEDYEEYVFQRRAILKNLTNRRLKITMPGNFQLSSGFNVNVLAPYLAKKNTAEDDEQNYDPNLRAKYVIIGARHIIGYEKHETVIEVATSSSVINYMTSHVGQTAELLNF